MMILMIMMVVVMAVRVTQHEKTIVSTYVFKGICWI